MSSFVTDDAVLCWLVAGVNVVGLVGVDEFFVDSVWTGSNVCHFSLAVWEKHQTAV